MVGIYDFSYAPYALGDALTWTMNVNIGAADAGVETVDQYLVIDPSRPASRYQSFIDEHNYLSVIDRLFPAFLCSPWLRSLKLIRDSRMFNLFLLRDVMRRRPMWPSLWSHLRRRLDFISHRRINRFYDRYGTLPWLTAPRGYGAWADNFRRTHCQGRFVVALHVRQGAWSLAPASLHRDSPWPEWQAFMEEIGRRHPDVVFVVLGGYAECDREAYRLPNALIPRTMGFGLGHELALVDRADLFMGSSSGFATMATFCNNIPYVITNIEHRFAPYAGVPIGARHYPFGGERQVLSWETETRKLLLDLFEQVRPGPQAA
jgi:hypothetical protein